MNNSTFNFALTVIGPVLLILALGYFLYKRRRINDEFVESGSKLVFTIALPALLFISISQSDFSQAANPTLILVGLIGTLVFFILLMAFCHFAVEERSVRGVVIQGGFRANMGIIGLAYCANTYGSEGLAAASVYMGLVTIQFNILSIFVLNYYLDGKSSISTHLKGIATNPLIISIVAALPFSYFQVPIPIILIKMGEYLAHLALPLALLCTGASLQFSSFSDDWKNIAISTICKCVLYPLTLIGISYLLGVRGMALGVIFLIAMAPTAAASYIMVRNLGGDHRLAASIIAVTTLVSLPITIVAFSALSALNLL